jgi:DNA-binding NarL/FixJ family response regulator
MGGRKRRIRVLIVDDHRTFAEALRIAIGLERDLEVVGVEYDAMGAVRAATSTQPDVVLMDLEMPGASGIDATRGVLATCPSSRVIALTAHRDDLVLARVLEAGAIGILSKSDEISGVPPAVRRAHLGEPLLPDEESRRLLRFLRHRRSLEASEGQLVDRLTPRETEILQAMADGLSPGGIASKLGVSPATLRTHVQNVLTKLRVHSKVEALALAIRHGKVAARR